MTALAHALVCTGSLAIGRRRQAASSLIGERGV